MIPEFGNYKTDFPSTGSHETEVLPMFRAQLILNEPVIKREKKVQS